MATVVGCCALIGVNAVAAFAGNTVVLGPSDNIAIDQPMVQVAVYSGSTLLGPQNYASFLLDSGSTTILAAQGATSELSAGGMQTVADYYESGVAGLSLTRVSQPYNFLYAGSSGVPLSLPNTRLLASSDLDLDDIGGVAGMPLMVGRNTQINLTTIATQLSSSVAFSAAPSQATAHRYDVPLQLVNFPLDGQVNSTDPLPTAAPLATAPVVLTNGAHTVQARFIIDTGAQTSIFSTAVATALGINPATDAIGSVPISGVGGTVNMPIVAADSIAVHTLQKTDLKWTALQVGVLDVDPNVAGVLGMDILDSGWLGTVLGGSATGAGYLSDVNFDLRSAANLNGDLLLDVDPSHDLATADNSGAWDFAGSGQATDVGKWYSPTAPGGVGSTLTFGNGVLNSISSGKISVTINTAQVASQIVFGNTSGAAFSLVGDGVAGHGLTLSGGGQGAAVTVAAGVTSPQQIQAPLTLADNVAFNVASGGLLTLTGGVSQSAGSHGLTLAGGGTLEIDSSLSLNSGSALNVNAGTLRLNAGTAGNQFGAGVTATITGEATVELAGSTSDLSAGATRVAIVNNSTAAAGLLVSGTAQRVGGITGSGAIVVEAGSDLTADSIQGGILFIEGTSTSHGVFALAPSDSKGQPLADDSFATMADVIAPIIGGAASSSQIAVARAALQPIDGAITPRAALLYRLESARAAERAMSVPEPAPLALASVGLAILIASRLAYTLKRMCKISPSRMT